MKQTGAARFLKTAMRFLSYHIRKGAKRRDVTYSFLFMHADGDQFGQIASLIDAAAIRPVSDRVFPFESTQEALAYVETGRAKGKIVCTSSQRSRRVPRRSHCCVAQSNIGTRASR